MFKGFDKRLKRDVQRLVDARLKESEELSKHKVKYMSKKIFNRFDYFSLNQLM
jgi:hypothetical protein